MTSDSINSYTYDAENRMKTVNSTAAVFSYDGNSLRVKKVAGSTTTVYVFSGSKVIAEYVNGALSKEYVYSGGDLLVTLNGSTPTYHHRDHLSTRVETDSSGQAVRSFGQLPFGDAWYETGAASKWKFTSYERDAESSLDYAVFRYHAWRLGRFVTPDPVRGRLQDPQSLNRYAYSRNDPVNMVDPLGLDPTYTISVTVYGNSPSSHPIASSNTSVMAQIPWGHPPAEVYLLVDKDGPGGSIAGHPSVFKEWFYAAFADILNECIKDVFGNDAKKIPTQTLANAPVVDTRKTIKQLTAMAGGRPARALPDANRGRHGTVYIAFETYYSRTSNTLNEIIGSYVHELGNILDGKLNPSSPPGKYMRNYGDPNNTWDTDTGAQLHLMYVWREKTISALSSVLMFLAVLSVAAASQPGPTETDEQWCDRDRDTLRPYARLGPMIVEQESLREEMLGKVRAFVWSHWSDQSRAVVMFQDRNPEGELSRVCFLVEPDEDGQWGLLVRIRRTEHDRRLSSKKKWLSIRQYRASGVERVTLRSRQDSTHQQLGPNEADPPSYLLRLLDQDGKELTIF